MPAHAVHAKVISGLVKTAGVGLAVVSHLRVQKNPELSSSINYSQCYFLDIRPSLAPQYGK
jgi:hypothetical protein